MTACVIHTCMPNKVMSVGIGAVAIAVAAPAVISVMSVVSYIWPIVPLLLVGGMWTNARRDKQQSNQTNNNLQ